MVVVAIDFSFVKICDYLYQHSTSGDTYKINYGISQNTSDVLIMGSSRASHHYNPQIMTDSLGMTVYNIGIDGSGIILMDGFYRLITQRYVPKYIIYELTPAFDIYKYDGDADNTRYLSMLKPYYSEECIQRVFDDVDSKERLKLNSGLYRYNTKFVTLARFYFKPESLRQDGFRPLKGLMDYSPERKDTKKEETDNLKIQYLKEFIRDCQSKGTTIFFVISPSYGETSSEAYIPAVNICREKGCFVLDHFCDTAFVYNKSFFKDSYHLNENGADIYTKKITSEIKALIK